MGRYIEIPILAAARRCGIRLDDHTLERREVQGYCPFCDGTKNHLFLNTETNQWYCQKCGRGGNAVTLYATVFKVDNKAAFRELTQDMRVEIDTLKFEMKNLNRMTDEEMIETMTFSTSLEERVKTSGTGNKTIGIALSYHEKLEQLRGEAKTAIAARLSALTLTVDRLDFYISKLPPVEAAVLREYYIENYSWRDLQELKGISAKTLIRYRDEALDTLVKMYTPLVDAGLLPGSNR